MVPRPPSARRSRRPIAARAVSSPTAIRQTPRRCRRISASKQRIRAGGRCGIAERIRPGDGRPLAFQVGDRAVAVPVRPPAALVADQERQRARPRRSTGRARAAASGRLGRPQGAEIDRRVPGLPTGEEALDRRVEDDLVELAQREEPMPAHSRVGRGGRLERPAPQVAREDDVHDVLRREAPLRRDRVDDRDRALERERSSIPTSSASSRRSASTSDSPEFTPPPGSSQYSCPGFSWRQSRMRSFQRRSAETRMRGSAAIRVPGRAEAALAALARRQLVHLAELGLRHGDEDELGDAHARLDHERLSRLCCGG